MTPTSGGVNIRSAGHQLSAGCAGVGPSSSSILGSNPQDNLLTPSSDPILRTIPPLHPPDPIPLRVNLNPWVGAVSLGIQPIVVFPLCTAGHISFPTYTSSTDDDIGNLFLPPACSLVQLSTFFQRMTEMQFLQFTHSLAAGDAEVQVCTAIRQSFRFHNKLSEFFLYFSGMVFICQ